MLNGHNEVVVLYLDGSPASRHIDDRLARTGVSYVRRYRSQDWGELPALETSSVTLRGAAVIDSCFLRKVEDEDKSLRADGEGGL